MAEGRRELLAELRRLAADPRWRVREGVVLGLQRWGAADLDALIDEMGAWARGSLLEQRAAVAALCEPPLLKRPEQVRRVLAVLDRVTENLAAAGDRRAEDFRVLRLALGYCWSVAAAALPEAGRSHLERWLRSSDPDVRWVMRQNLGKARIGKLGKDWLARWQAVL